MDRNNKNERVEKNFLTFWNFEAGKVGVEETHGILKTSSTWETRGSHTKWMKNTELTEPQEVARHTGHTQVGCADRYPPIFSWYLLWRTGEQDHREGRRHQQKACLYKSRDRATGKAYKEQDKIEVDLREMQSIVRYRNGYEDTHAIAQEAGVRPGQTAVDCDTVQSTSGHRKGYGGPRTGWLPWGYHYRPRRKGKFLKFAGKGYST